MLSTSFNATRHYDHEWHESQFGSKVNLNSASVQRLFLTWLLKLSILATTACVLSHRERSVQMVSIYLFSQKFSFGARFYFETFKAFLFVSLCLQFNHINLVLSCSMSPEDGDDRNSSMSDAAD